EAFDLEVKYGVIVNEVVDDSPAEEAGLENDDIIVSIDGERITDYDDLVDMLAEHGEGDQITIGLIRDGKALDVQVKLAKRPRGRHDLDWRFQYSYDYRTPFGRSHSYIGVQLSDLTDQLGEFFGVDRGRGALIREVEEDSPAADAGLKAGDVIISIDTDQMRDAGDVVEYILDTDPGDQVSITVIRDKAELTAKAEVGESPGGSRYGDIFHGFDGLFGLRRLDVLDALDYPDHDLSIRIPSLRTPMVTGYFDPDDFDSRKLKREMKRLRKEMLDMQKELRYELKHELDELREMIDN
ncbi:MAG: PDZ domain-containing protein, partial [candidate division Zixibacteria bacterium]|nr:PDZ domain-containing protein [candidate division Zixibacteria bacterium]